jgi:hypothetical protein
MPETDR